MCGLGLEDLQVMTNIETIQSQGLVFLSSRRSHVTKLKFDPLREQNYNILFKLRSSMTRLGDLLDFGQLFKACGDKFLPKLPTLLCNFCKGVEIFHFSCEIIFGQLLYTFGHSDRK